MTNCQGQPPLPPQGAQLTNLTPCLLAMPKAPIHTGRVLHKWWLLLFIFQCSLLFNEMLGFGGAHWVEECTPKWYNQVLASLVAQRLKRLPGMRETWVRSLIPWRRKWQPTPVLLPGKSHGGRSLVGFSPWGHKELDTTERLHFHFTFMHWRRKWQPTPVFLPGESQGKGNMVGCRLWGRRVGHNWSELAAAAASQNDSLYN